MGWELLRKEYATEFVLPAANLAAHSDVFICPHSSQSQQLQIANGVDMEDMLVVSISGVLLLWTGCNIFGNAAWLGLLDLSLYSMCDCVDIFGQSIPDGQKSVAVFMNAESGEPCIVCKPRHTATHFARLAQ